MSINLSGIIASGLGVNQNWQDVTSSRSLGTNYTNTSSSPITVIVSGSGSSPSTVYTPTVNSVAIASVSASSSVFESACVTFIVPAGQTYSIAITTGSGSLTKWCELK